MALLKPAGIARRPHQHAGHGLSRDFEGRSRPANRRRRASRPTSGSAWDPGLLLHEGRRLRAGDGEPSADAVRDRRFAGRPGGLDARSRRASQALIARVFAGNPRGSRATTSWTTSRTTGSRTRPISSARLYWESQLAFFDLKSVRSRRRQVFPDELYPAPRSWAERAYPKLIHSARRKRAATSRPGSSRRRSPRRSARRSGRCADRFRAICRRRQTRRPGCLLSDREVRCYGDSPLPGRRSRRSLGGPASSDRRDAVAVQGARRGSLAGRAAGDDAGAHPLLGDRVRLAQVRGEAQRAAAVQDRDRQAWTSTSSTSSRRTRTRCR